MTNKLRVLRAERVWSQADLAQRLKVSRQTINAIETGKYCPSLPLAFAIAKVFGLSIEEIFEPAEEPVSNRGLARIVAAQKKRWAKVRAAKKQPAGAH